MTYSNLDSFEKRLKSLKANSLLFLICCMMLVMTGCVTALKSDKIVSIKQRVFGISIGASATTETPEIKLGLISTVYQMIPTSTNSQVYAPRYFDTLQMDSTSNPFHAGWIENTGAGDVQVSTNAQGQAIIPKVNIPSKSK